MNRVRVDDTPFGPIEYSAPDEGHFFSNSELGDFQWCKRYWWLKYYRRLGVPREDPGAPAAVGSLAHLGLQHYYEYGREPRRAWEVITRAAQIVTDFYTAAGDEVTVQRMEKTEKLVRTMLEGYFEWLEETGADSDFTVTGVEEKVSAPTGLPNIWLIGKFDLRVASLVDGSRYFLDHKIVQSIEQTSEFAYLNPQFRHYHVLERMARGDSPFTDGVVVNMLRKVGRTKAAKPPFYGRTQVRHNPTMLENHYTHVMSAVIEILSVRDALDGGFDHHSIVPPSPNRDCSWRCPFRRVCPMFDDGGDAEFILETDYVTVDPLARYETESEDA